ncbi:MAG: hypothetical protein ACFCBW_03670 [Candidatus Competibacterales bacterium]
MVSFDDIDIIDINPPFGNDPIGWELAVLTRALFEGERIVHGQGEWEIDLHRTLAEAPLQFIDARVSSHNPIAVTGGRFRRTGELLLRCPPMVVSPLLDNLHRHGDHALRRGLLLQGVRHVTTVVAAGATQHWVVRPDYDEKLRWRRRSCSTLRPLQRLMAGGVDTREQITLITDSRHGQRQALATLARPRERSVLYRNGFRHIAVLDPAIVIFRAGRLSEVEDLWGVLELEPSPRPASPPATPRLRTWSAPGAEPPGLGGAGRWLLA